MLNKCKTSTNNLFLKQLQLNETTSKDKKQVSQGWQRCKNQGEDPGSLPCFIVIISHDSASYLIKHCLFNPHSGHPKNASCFPKARLTFSFGPHPICAISSQQSSVNNPLLPFMFTAFTSQLTLILQSSSVISMPSFMYQPL